MPDTVSEGGMTPNRRHYKASMALSLFCLYMMDVNTTAGRSGKLPSTSRTKRRLHLRKQLVLYCKIGFYCGIIVARRSSFAVCCELPSALLPRED